MIQHRQITVNDICLHIADIGEGPLVIFIHGFPESWYSWRHQLPAIAQAGYRAVALDMPGYGDSDAPGNIHRYNQIALSNDIAALATALGYEQFVVVGHDWGAPTAWYTALRFPERVDAVVAMSVPYGAARHTRRLRAFANCLKTAFSICCTFRSPGLPKQNWKQICHAFYARFYSVAVQKILTDLIPANSRPPLSY